MKKVTKNVLIFIISGALFFAFTVPFHKIFAVFTVSEVRLSAVLYPLLGINFGLPAALGIATANLASDIINGYNFGTIFFGSISQILYSMIPYYIWRYFVRNDEHKHRLDSVKRVLQFAFVCCVSAILAAIVVGLICVVNYKLEFFKVAIFVFLNNFEISIILGCPLMILTNQIVSRARGTDRVVTLNEKIIIASAVVEIIALSIFVVSMYSKAKVIDTFDIWNTIYYYILVLIAILLILSLIAMIIFENKFIKSKK